MEIGDIALIHSTPPHIASITSGDACICEDGTVLPLSKYRITKLCTALDVIRELERSILEQARSG